MKHGMRRLFTSVAIGAIAACVPARSVPSETATTTRAAPSETATQAPAPSGSAARNDTPSMMGEQHMFGGMMAGICPMQVVGTTVMANDVEDGVALVFATKTGDVAELRQRVQRMADMHERMTGMHGRSGGMMRGGPDGGVGDGKGMMMRGCMMEGGMMMPAATATVEDVEGGARLILRPRDPSTLEVLRKHARECNDRMQRGDCPMMGVHGKQGPEAPPTGEK